MGSYKNLFILLAILMVVGFFYRRFEDKRIREENKDNYNAIQKYLLDGDTLHKSKKPILWVHIPYEYNSRNWQSFGSRSSFELNQPYLYLTFRSILKHCDQSFTICILDDNSFKKLIPNWNIELNHLSDPIQTNMRTLGMMKLLYIYGGMICPVSFLCMRNLIDMYQTGTRGNKMFVCETISKNNSSSGEEFSPNVSFCGAPRECHTVSQFCDYIRILNSYDHSGELEFLGKYNAWCKNGIEKGKINIIDAQKIGMKSINDTPILLDDLMSNHYLDIYKGTYGILIPAKELLNRVKFEWFVRMSPKQVLKSNTIIGNYLLLSIGPEQEEGILEPVQMEPNWIGFWKTPLYDDLYGLKPNYLGNNLVKHK